MMVLGLTGGIGAGKSTVAGMFAELGTPTFDADEIARAILSEDAGLCRSVAARFPSCSDRHGGIDRQALAKTVFSSDEDLADLEALMHPAIWQAFVRRSESTPAAASPFCLLEGAVLLESKTRYPLAGMIVVTAPRSTRLRRLQVRGGLDTEQILARMSAQSAQDEKLLHATHVIDNSMGLDQTRHQVIAVRQDLLRELGGEA